MLKVSSLWYFQVGLFNYNEKIVTIIYFHNFDKIIPLIRRVTGLVLNSPWKHILGECPLFLFLIKQ